MTSSSLADPASRCGRFSCAFKFRHGGMLIFIGLLLGIGFVTRVALLCKSADGVAFDASLAGAFGLGFVFDLAMAVFFTLIPSLVLAALPERAFRSGVFRFIAHAMFCAAIATFLFIGVSEWLFWDEFGVRFNFIAVDYLVYTTEVVKNIHESYNLPLILAGIAGASGLIWASVVRTGVFAAWIRAEEAAKGRGRFVGAAACVAPVLIAGIAFYARGAKDIRSSSAGGGFVEKMSAGLRHMGELQPAFRNAFNGELAKNGQYAFVAAFWGNELDYDDFYPKLEGKDGVDSFRRLRGLLKQDNVTFASDDPKDITRVIRGNGPEKRMNVIQITIESLSAEFLGCYGDGAYGPMNLSPNIDALAGRSLWFRHAYAGGTRTVRGMEALSLSIPPTPGQAILRRPGCENQSTLGAVFKNHGYDCAFIYGGDGLFDNMNYFFANNGYRVIDKPARLKEHPDTKIHFANAWGVCDEDLFDWVLDEADTSFAKGQPFHHFVMSTSNHRPYTWPAGRISPKLTGREGGVAYTDHAIGRFLKMAAEKPWFKNTVFVIVADHCASVAGKRELEVRKYEIPLFIYSPGNVTPRLVETPMSQIDLAPTVLGLLDFSYASRFFGHDVLRPTPVPPREFISNYQKIGLIEGGKLAVLKPVRQGVTYDCDLATGELTPGEAPELVRNAVAWYGCAARLFKTGRLTAPSAEEENALLQKTR